MLKLTTHLYGTTLMISKTLPRKLRSQNDYSYETTDELRVSTADSDSPPTVLQLLRLPLMRSVCISGCALSFVGSAFDVVFVLFCYSSVKMGGLGFSVSRLILLNNSYVSVLILQTGFSDRICSSSRRHTVRCIPDRDHASSSAQLLVHKIIQVLHRVMAIHFCPFTSS